MNIFDLTSEDEIEIGTLRLLESGVLTEPELFKALGKWHVLVVHGVVVQLVLDEKLDMRWENNELHFGLAKGVPDAKKD